LHIDGLTRDDVHELVRHYVGHALDEPLATLSAAIADETGGKRVFRRRRLD
jgi:hypothetical protein